MNLIKTLFSGRRNPDEQAGGQLVKESAPCHSWQALLERYGALALEKQQNLGEIIDGLSWEADMKSGRIGFAGKVAFPMQILGTLSRSSETWLWSWANTLSDIAPRQLAQALRMRRYGEENGITLLSQAELPIKEEELDIIGLIAAGMFNTSGYYLADFERGIMCVTLKSADIDDSYTNAHHAVLTIFPRFISLYDVDHRNALCSYLQLKGYEVSQEADKVTGCRQDGTITAEFDEHSRLRLLQG
ncbi:DUF6882 domain-containing protein [Enterobacillus tribolii]|uniref:Uncharacterized protein n=1 Tax=Enterobacillus tribolii TaxID=1487935 RepID=A0A370QMK7_9GAMM|nr:DUF6882 domain-containing protein [Enterobacillus tribolii]MBW7982419.1 hypothetical protein [Enterobacillus tribolii]RDK89585.1 hypothetical protein C8D90_107238 [Enterobacillus tribolii]